MLDIDSSLDTNRTRYFSTSCYIKHDPGHRRDHTKKHPKGFNTIQSLVILYKCK